MAKEFQNFTDLDFDSIKDNLVEYMKSRQSEGKLEGFEFEGSTMNMLMDLLAYNTQYNAFYLNSLASERFIGTAQKRSSVVNIAKTLGYLPRTAKPSSSFLDLQITPVAGHSGNIVIPSNTKFTSKIEGETFNFITESEVIVQPSLTGTYTVQRLKVIEGSSLSFKQEIRDEDRGVTLPNRRVDSDSLRVFVSSDSSVLGEEYVQENNFGLIQRDSNVYFVEELEGEFHRIFFGDDVLGRAAIPGQFVTIEYRVSKGSLGNGAKLFSLADDISNAESVTITNSTQSTGGADIEDIESIRVSAPGFFQRQNRAVTAEDYASVVKDIFPSAIDVTAFGGEDLENPAFGFVFVSILQQQGALLSDTRKEELETILKDRFAALSIRPQVIDPSIIYLDLKTLVSYDSRNTNPGAGTLREDARQAALDFVSENGNRFNGDFKFSKYLRSIDDSNQAVLSNRSQVSIYIEFTSAPQLAEIENFSLGQAVVPGSVRTNQFVFSGITAVLEPNDTDNRFLDLKSISPDLTRVTLFERVLRIDYDTGRVFVEIDTSDFGTLLFTISDDQPLRVFADVRSGDVFSTNNNVLFLREENLQVEVVDVVTGLSTGIVSFDSNI